MKIKLPSWCILHSGMKISPCWKSLFFFFSAVSFINSSSNLSFLFDPSHFWILFSLQNQFLRSIASTLNWLIPTTVLPRLSSYLWFPMANRVTSSWLSMHILHKLYLRILTLFGQSLCIPLCHGMKSFWRCVLGWCYLHWITGEYSVTIQSKYSSRHDKMILKCCLLSLNWLFCLRKKKFAV